MWRSDRKPLLAGLLAALLALTGTPAQAEALEGVRETGALKVAVYRDFPPFSYRGEQGRYTGVDVELARAIAREMGVGLELMLLTPDENMEDDLRNAVWKGHYLGGGTADVMMHVPTDPAFAADNDQVHIFGDYFREEIAIAHNTVQLPSVASAIDLSDARVGVELDSVSDFYLSSSYKGRLRANALRYRDTVTAVEALRRGEVAAVMAPRAQIEGALTAAGVAGDYPVKPMPLSGLYRSSWQVGMAVRRDSPALRDALAAALEALRARGELPSVFEAHGVTYLEPRAAVQGMARLAH